MSLKSGNKIEVCGSWPEMEQGLLGTLGDDLESSILKSQFERGLLRGYRVNDGVCYSLIRYEDKLKECCVVALKGRGLSGFVSDLIIEAKEAGYEKIRCHVTNRALIRLIQKTNPDAYEHEIVIKMRL